MFVTTLALLIILGIVSYIGTRIPSSTSEEGGLRAEDFEIIELKGN